MATPKINSTRAALLSFLRAASTDTLRRLFLAQVDRHLACPRRDDTMMQALIIVTSERA